MHKKCAVLIVLIFGALGCSSEEAAVPLSRIDMEAEDTQGFKDVGGFKDSGGDVCDGEECAECVNDSDCGDPKSVRCHANKCVRLENCHVNTDCQEKEYCHFYTLGECKEASKEGVCKKQAEISTCVPGGKPICGCDGLTYETECAANAAGTSVFADEACEKWCDGEDIKAYGAVGDGLSHPMSAEDIGLLPAAHRDLYTPGDERDAIAIQEALFAIKDLENKTICIPDGNYILNRALPTSLSESEKRKIETNAWLSSEPETKETSVVYFAGMNQAHFVGEKTSSFSVKNEKDIIWHMETNQKEKVGDVNFKNLRFNHVALNVIAPFNVKKFGPMNIEDCHFLDGPNLQIHFVRVQNIHIKKTLFERTFERPGKYNEKNKEKDYSNGKGISFNHSHFIDVIDNKFLGFYVTAINITGLDHGDETNLFGPFDINERSHKVRILNNEFVRDTATIFQDHGIYIWGADGVEVSNNSIKGWESFEDERLKRGNRAGAIKVRNGENYKILNNKIEDTGIILYSYASKFMPRYLLKVLVKGNTITIKNPINEHCGYRGILYWRNYNPIGNHIHEDEIVIEDNKITGGCVRIYPPDNNFAGFTMKNNKSTDFQYYFGNKLVYDYDHQGLNPEDYFKVYTNNTMTGW